MIEIFDCEQQSPEWFRARRGIPTASELPSILAVGKSGAESKMRQTYMRKLAGEILTGEPTDSYANTHMDRGKEMEAEARDFYAFIQDAESQRVGFVRNGNVGCSPDSLIDKEGLLEIKTALPHILIDKLLRDEFPPEHKAQCQGQLWVTEREWVDIAIYWPKLPLFVKRAVRDDGYIANLAGAVKAFNDELAALVEQVRRYGRERAA